MLAEIRHVLDHENVVYVSAHTGEGIDELTSRIELSLLPTSTILGNFLHHELRKLTTVANIALAIVGRFDALEEVIRTVRSDCQGKVLNVIIESATEYRIGRIQGLPIAGFIPQPEQATMPDTVADSISQPSTCS